MGSFKALNSRDNGNEGIKLPLTTVDGKDAGEYLIIRSVDSDAFREAEIDGKRDVLRAAQIDDMDERRRIAKESTLKMQTALVKAWSFDEPCDETNIREFLIGAPHIADAIDQLAAKRSLFIEKKSQSSKPSQRSKRTSTKSRKAQKSANENT